LNCSVILPNVAYAMGPTYSLIRIESISRYRPSDQFNQYDLQNQVWFMARTPPVMQKARLVAKSDIAYIMTRRFMLAARWRGPFGWWVAWLEVRVTQYWRVQRHKTKCQANIERTTTQPALPTGPSAVMLPFLLVMWLCTVLKVGYFFSNTNIGCLSLHAPFQILILCSFCKTVFIEWSYFLFL